MIVLLLFLQILPASESFAYETNEKGRIDSIFGTSRRDSLGYHVRYVWDREIEIIFDSGNLSTLYLRKIVDGQLELEIKKEKKFLVNFKGRESQYSANDPVYDRHALEFALRGFNYHEGFKGRFRLHIPEFMVVNADLEVLGEEAVVTELGTFECWKIKMKPRVLFFNWRFFFHIEKEYPHRFVKYSDSSGENVITLISYTSD
ncbi:hypothetical protein AMJ83_01200 [candidate division WOR_3 bacterium SM23_42]|uniref:DUF3108 domain-containing protein n=1 Tax=candidate division WOR_3 bacterium SM23_42 TaxID=1703779 RepID=A0A0S8FVX6_UNCW3|nr:MAG: hypothetical protein AMJ83_01200 [candidate division WOR_3 bacterium SM23_42]